MLMSFDIYIYIIKGQSLQYFKMLGIKCAKEQTFKKI